MPTIILLPLLVYVGVFAIKVIVFIPLELIGMFSIPGWLSLGAIALVLSWCFGD